MKTFSIMSAICLVVLGSSLAAGQTHRGDPRTEEAVNEKHCLHCHGRNWTAPDRMGST